MSVGFDPRHDHLTGYVFQTNPSAVQADFSLSDDDREDRDYNAVWEVRTQIGERGWMAEFRIPFSQMRFAVLPAPGQVWGFQTERLVRRKGERGTWVGKPRGERGEVSLYGHLIFDTPLAASRRLEAAGGPPILDPAATFYYFNFGSDSRKSWRINFGGNGQRGDEGNYERAFNANMSVQPSGRLQISVSARHVKGIDIAQWIENSDTTGDGEDDHIYGTLRRNVIDITMRATYSIHRDLTLQAYLQPFVAVGRYENIRRLARPNSFDFAPAAIDSNSDSTASRFAAMSCCDGSICAAALSFWYGTFRRKTNAAPAFSDRCATSEPRSPLPRNTS